jgi:thiamine biosynthesis lipoprotein
VTADAGTGTFGVFGTTAVLLVTEPGRLGLARSIADSELASVDQACSRFRPDSELSILNDSDGSPTQVSHLFGQLIEAALRAARLTSGAVDPTCGLALAAIGYDRDFADVKASGDGPRDAPGAAGQVPAPGRVPGWQAVRFGPGRRVVQLADRAQLDLGATAKAWAADRCARLIFEQAGCGVLVSLGGDIAVAGPAPAGGWQVRVTDDHAAGPEAPGQTVTISSGGLATSSTTVRSWASGGHPMHHIIDPATGQPARSCWRTVSVAAGNCVDANTASTAAIIRGEAALPWLRGAGLPARLVAHDGTVQTTAGWPADRQRDAVPTRTEERGSLRPSDDGEAALKAPRRRQ